MLPDGCGDEHSTASLVVDQFRPTAAAPIILMFAILQRRMLSRLTAERGVADEHGVTVHRRLHVGPGTGTGGTTLTLARIVLTGHRT